MLKSVVFFGICWLALMLGISSGQTTLIASGDYWKYLDDGSDQGIAWYNKNFNDAAWPGGKAPLGYGDGDEATVVNYGSNAVDKHITTYFRKAFTVADAALFGSYTLSIKRDDGVVIYLNGAEVYRNNMPAGNITAATLADTACSDDGNKFLVTALPYGALLSGVNVIAVEIHQSSVTSSDISFNLSLKGNHARLTRGPYLQIGTPTSVYVRWRTDIPVTTKVSYGLSPDALTASVGSHNPVTEHELQLAGLKPDTKYYYAIGNMLYTLQGNADNYFFTAPLIGTEKKTHIWVNGDCGNNSTNQLNVRNHYQNYMGANTTNVWLLLGDNAYENGLDQEYQTGFFDVYKDKLLKQTVLWPAPGNHDYANDTTKQKQHDIPYYSAFTLPSKAEAGGVPSHTEAYYSYNYANIHFIALDSYGKEANQYRLYDTLGPQAIWLKQDLAANTQKWTIAYWHHPPYTMGSHNSDTEEELVNMRQNFIRLLERYNVDLILCGHSHCYERSKLMKGHYSNEASFNAGEHHLSSSSGIYDGSVNSCPYIKNAGNNHSGTVYVVAGSAGQLGGMNASFPHDAMYYSDATNGGSLAIDIEANRLNAKWVCADGSIRDQFTMIKDAGKINNINISPGQSATLTASWIGDYNWSEAGDKRRSITVSPAVSTTYTVSDRQGCLTDVFHVTISTSTDNKTAVAKDKLAMYVYPNPFSEHTTIAYTIPHAGTVNIEVYDNTGRKLKLLLSKPMVKGSYNYTLRPKADGFSAGVYMVKLFFNGQTLVQKMAIKE